MKLDYLLAVLLDFRSRHGGDLDVIVNVSDLHIDVESVSVLLLEIPPGEKVVSVNANQMRE